MTMIGNLFIISAPSGTGKTSLAASLRNSLTNIYKSVSHTTRERRAGEVDGQHYHFVSVEEFNQMLVENIFLEHAKVFGNYYGTSRDWILRTTQQGHDVVLEIDWQGAQQIKQKMPEVVTIFILPPSLRVLRERLMLRNQDSAASIELRLAEAKNEVAHFGEYDYLVVNDDFEKALDDLKAIVTSVRLRCERQRHDLRGLLRDLSGAEGG